MSRRRERVNLIYHPHLHNVALKQLFNNFIFLRMNSVSPWRRNSLRKNISKCVLYIIAAIPGDFSQDLGNFQSPGIMGRKLGKFPKSEKLGNCRGILKYKLNEDIIVLYFIILLWNNI